MFTKNRDGNIARAFFERVCAQADRHGLLSDEHFTVDGTLIDAWASLKSFQRKNAPASAPDDPGNPTVSFHGERRSNATHVSTTDPQARLYRKGDRQEAKLRYQGHVLMENRYGLAIDGCLTAADGYGERAAGLEMVGPRAPKAGTGPRHFITSSDNRFVYLQNELTATRDHAGPRQRDRAAYRGRLGLRPSAPTASWFPARRAPSATISGPRTCTSRPTGSSSTPPSAPAARSAA